MPPTNPRKRQAPSSPIPQAPQMQQAYNAPSQLSDADFLRWGQVPGNTNYATDPAFNMNNYGGEAIAQPQYDASIQAPSTQLARRPVNRQLVPTAQRSAYDNSGDPWGQFGDESILDPQNNGRMEENDNIELLEEKAAVAKREAQSKRKQIPPFVQKLSR
jgi:heat shock transcription factor